MAILLDVLNFLPIVEDRIMGKGTNVSDIMEIISLRQSLHMLERMVMKCETAVSVEDFSFLCKRISVARETVDILATRSTATKCPSDFCDVLALPRECSEDAECTTNYASCLNMTNDEFDTLIDEWAADVDAASSNVRNKRKSRASVGSQQEKIRSDIVKLADTMKSKALWYRDILVKDNEALSKTTVEQEKQLDTVAHVATEASKLTKTARLSLRQSIAMVASMFFLVLFMMLIFIIT